MILEKLEDFWWKIRWSSRATALPHFFAMWSPLNSVRLFFYRLRGVRIGKGVYIVQGCFLEESRPWLITIEDGVRMGAGVTIATHDAVYLALDSDLPIRYGEVVLKKGCTIGPCCVILPGVTIGEYALVGAGAVVVRDVPPRAVYAAPVATFLKSFDDGLVRYRENAESYRAVDRKTKYPWRFRSTQVQTQNDVSKPA